jgi:hypothetical protein
MRNGTAAALAALATLAGGLAAAGGLALEDKREASRELVGQFGKTLKGELMSALGSGGPVTAVEVCSVRAPAIAESVSADTPATVSRTALRVRNRNNAPAPWQKEVLLSFEAALAAGESPESLEYLQPVREDGVTVVRYMKPIMTEPLCVTCHGSGLAPDLASKIEALYPGDEATGFSPGELRGAFVVVWPTDEGG